MFRGREAWRALVRRYAEGRPVCNRGGGAYYKAVDGSLRCEYGCSANLIAAREDIALKVLAELGEHDARGRG